MAKVNAASLLRQEFLKKSWKGETIIFSFTSDPYIPLEASYELTRKCLEVCLEFRNPVGIITKSALVRRDVDLLARLATEARATVYFTVPFLDREVTRALEPQTPSPEARFGAMRDLSAAGIEVGLALAPLIPGLNEHEIPAILQQAAEAGARRAFINLLRLPGSVEGYFLERLEADLPLRAKKIVNRIREVKGGQLNRPGFHDRMQGLGPYWEMITRSFEIHSRRLGFNERQTTEGRLPTTFRRPSSQGRLFE